MSDELENVPTDQLVRIYRRIRDAVKEREAKFEDEIKVLKTQLETVGNALLKICNEQNADSIKTSEGTISRRVNSRYWTTDWQSMYDLINEHHAPYLLEQRLHNGNMKQFLEEHPDVVPAGLQCDRKYVLHVRKPTGKKEDEL